MKALRTIVPVAISILIVVILVVRLDFSQLRSIWQLANTGLIILGTICLVASQFFAAFRWNAILNVLGHGIGSVRAVKMYFANLPISRVAPLFSGDFTKAYYLRREHVVGRNLGAVFVEPYLDMVVLSVMVVLGSLYDLNSWLWLGLGMLGLVVVLGLSIAFFPYKPKNQRLAETIIQFRLAFREVWQSFFSAFLIIGMTILAWAGMIICSALFLRAFGASVSVLTVLRIQPLIILISLLPVTFGGLGSREAGMLAFYGSIASGSSVFSAGFLFSILNSILFPLICMPLLIRQLKSSILTHD